jgi:hypothetical protein
MTGQPVRYGDRLEDRLALPHIKRNLPEYSIREAQPRFTDTATGHRIAVATVVYGDADQLMMVAFEETASEIVAVSVHPLDERDVERKVRNGKWRACLQNPRSAMTPRPMCST